MIRVCWLFFMLIVVGTLSAQSPRLIIRGDDMGYTHSANKAILDSYLNGIMTTVEVMPITPWFPEVVKMCNDNPDLDVGIHLSLTSEWTNLKWRPITCAPSLTDSDGYFYPMIWPNENYKGKALTENDWKIEEIEAEVRAQIELVLKNIPHVSHVSAHMGWISMHPEVTALVENLTKDYGIDIQPEKNGVMRARYEGPKKTVEDKVTSFSNMLKSLKNGKTYLFVDHPALDTDEQQAVNHIGYMDVAADRAGVTQIWTHPDIKILIKRLNIKLISYKDLADN